MNQPVNSLMLADGTVMENSSCGYADKSLWCWISGRSMTDCFPIFSDSKKTNEIVVLFRTGGIRYKGFTELTSIRKGTDVFGKDTIDIRLTWPEDGEHSIEEFQLHKDEEEEAEAE